MRYSGSTTTRELDYEFVPEALERLTLLLLMLRSKPGVKGAVGKSTSRSPRGAGSGGAEVGEASRGEYKSEK